MSEPMKNHTSRTLFAERLRDARARLRGLTQAKLAEKTGLPSTCITRFETSTGGRKPSLDTLIRLANALEVTTDYLLGLSDDHVGNPMAEDTLYRDTKNLTDKNREFSQAMIKKLPKKISQKSLVDKMEPRKNRTIRATDEEWEKCQLMGGAAWIREKINEEPLDLWINEKQDIVMIK